MQVLPGMSCAGGSLVVSSLDREPLGAVCGLAAVAEGLVGFLGRC